MLPDFGTGIMRVRGAMNLVNRPDPVHDSSNGDCALKTVMLTNVVAAVCIKSSLVSLFLLSWAGFQSVGHLLGLFKNWLGGGDIDRKVEDRGIGDVLLNNRLRHHLERLV